MENPIMVRIGIEIPRTPNDFIFRDSNLSIRKPFQEFFSKGIPLEVTLGKVRLTLFKWTLIHSKIRPSIARFQVRYI